MPKITNKNKSISRVLTSIALAVSLNACEMSSVRRGQLYDITSPAVESSSFYMQKASTEPTAKADWHLLAAKALIKENKLDEAYKLISDLAKMPLVDLQIAEWQLLRAEVLILQNNPKSAIESLKFNDSWKLPSTQWRRYFLMRYEGYNKLDDNKNSLIALINLEQYVQKGEEQQLSDQIWAVLSRTSAADLQLLGGINQESLTDWISLLSNLRKTLTPAKKQQIIDEWVSANPNHLAANFLPSKLVNLSNLEINKPNSIGVILPLSKKFALQGETIRNGLMQALINDKNSNFKPDFNFYDTNTMSISSIISDMKNKSVQFVIGPLQKNKVQEFITLNQGEFSHLALNIPSADFHNSGSCFFTLSPEQEAEQAAIRIAKKHRYPVVIAPNNELGRRVSKAFAKRWQTTTGRKTSIEYFANSAGMQQAVIRALGLEKSQSRSNQLNKLLGLDMVSEPRSRRDIDAVYLIAGSGELTLLKPFIEVSINPGAKIPKLYASSRSNNQPRGVPTVAELNGIEFSDVPLLVEPNSAEAKRFHKIWPNMNNNMIRLYALGMDTYALLSAIPQMQADPKFRHKGESGTLFLSPPCTVNRIMPWAVYTSSGAKPIE